MLIALGEALALTLAMELPVAYLWRLWGRDLLLAGLVNLVTNPAVGLCHLLWPSPLLAAALELGAFAVEGFYYRRYGRNIPRPFRLSAAANGASLGLGLLLSALGLRL